MTLCRSVAMLVSLVLVPLTVTAAPLPEPTVEYSADSTMQTEGGMTMKSRVYHTPTKQRMEMGGAEGSVTIIRKDKQVIWQVMGDMYMEMPLDQSMRRTWAGSTFKNRPRSAKRPQRCEDHQDENHRHQAGRCEVRRLLLDDQRGVTVKMDLLSKDGEKKMRMASELTNVKIEKQDPALFEVPAGATKNDLGAMMGRGHAESGRDDEQRRAGTGTGETFVQERRRE